LSKNVADIGYFQNTRVRKSPRCCISLIGNYVFIGGKKEKKKRNNRQWKVTYLWMFFSRTCVRLAQLILVASNQIAYRVPLNLPWGITRVKRRYGHVLDRKPWLAKMYPKQLDDFTQIG